jgi:hypothetical protein
MTTISRGYRATQTGREIDVRCSAQLPQHRSDEGRCQLFAGHDGPHAVMFAQGGKRLLRTWKSRHSSGAADYEANALQRPWMYGYPSPAWVEPDVDAAN